MLGLDRLAIPVYPLGLGRKACTRPKEEEYKRLTGNVIRAEQVLEQIEPWVGANFGTATGDSRLAESAAPVQQNQGILNTACFTPAG